MAQRVAIRTDGKFAHREDTIDGVTRFYDCNQTRALLAAAEDVPRLAEGIESVLGMDDLTRQQRREIAEKLSTPSLKFRIMEEIDVTPDV